jgi:hypothetical protein
MEQPLKTRGILDNEDKGADLEGVKAEPVADQ